RIFIEQIKKRYGFNIEGKIELGKDKKERYYFVNDVLAFIGDELIPTLCAVTKLKLELPYVTIDEGAVRAVANGADLFVPGILEYNCECKVGDIILVKTKTGLPVAIMKVVMDKKSAIETKKGKFAINLHYVGDKIWEMCKGK
ncbi:MAG: DUF1947 domain-containing protein, partial [Sulfolobaceae archaeon]